MAQRQLILHVNRWTETPSCPLQSAKIEEIAISSFFQERGWQILVMDWHDVDLDTLLCRRAIDLESLHEESVSLQSPSLPSVIFARSLGSVEAQYDEILSYFTALHQNCPWPVINHPDAVRRGIDKSYFGLLKSNAVPVIPNVGFRRDVTLEMIKASIPWPSEDCVVKPVCGECGNLVERLRDVDESFFQEWRSLAKGWIVQPFMDGFYEGEWSLIFIGTRCIATVRKRPINGEYRVNARWTPTYQQTDASQEQLALAARALSAVDTTTYLSRVDMIRQGEQWLVTEVETVNPGFIYSEDAHSELARTLLVALEALCARLLLWRIRKAARRGSQVQLAAAGDRNPDR